MAFTDFPILAVPDLSLSGTISILHTTISGNDLWVLVHLVKVQRLTLPFPRQIYQPWTLNNARSHRRCDYIRWTVNNGGSRKQFDYTDNSSYFCH
jgi:hypothetical protein